MVDTTTGQAVGEFQSYVSPACAALSCAAIADADRPLQRQANKQTPPPLPFAQVSPTEHPQLDPFCTRLTGITQSQVDAAPPLSAALRRLEEWVGGLAGVAAGSLAAASWTSWDLEVSSG
jgi:hypothetical protein